MSEKESWPKSDKEPEWLEHHRSCAETYLLCMTVKCLQHGIRSELLAKALSHRLADAMVSMADAEVDDLLVLADSCLRHFEIYPEEEEETPAQQQMREAREVVDDMMNPK